MISLFSVEAEAEPVRRRAAYLKRLEEIAETPDSDGSLVHPSDPEGAIPEANPMNPIRSNGNPIDHIAFSSTEAEPEFNNGAGGRAEHAPSVVQKLVEEVAPKFTEAFTTAAETMYRMAMEDRLVLAEAVNQMAGVSERLDGLSRDLRSIREVTASLSQTQMGLSSRVAAVESSLENKVYLALEQGIRKLGESIREDQQAAEAKVSAVVGEVAQVSQRLEAQAGAIRALHETVQDQLGRREQLRAVLDRVTEITNSFVPPKPLPDQL